MTDANDPLLDRLMRGRLVSRADLSAPADADGDLAKALIDSKALTPEQLVECIRDIEQAEKSGARPSLAETVTRLKLVSEDRLRAVLSSIARMFGRYRLIRKLGEGGAGEVWQAEDPALGRVVALKILTPLSKRDEEVFDREARIMATLNHPNIVPIYAVERDQGKPALAMKYIEGRALNDTTLEVAEALRVALGVAAALQAVHAAGIVHRDVKPGNILVTPDGGVFLADFGIAKPIQHAPGKGLTATGSILGTPEFMSPEQARGDLRSIDARSDVYSLGATMYRLMAGVAPYDGDTVFDVTSKVVQGELTPPRRRNPRIPAAVEAVILKAMSPKKEDRYAGAADLARDLERAIAGETVEAPTPRVWEPARRWIRRHRLLLASNGLLLALAAVFFWVVSPEAAESLAQRSFDKARALAAAGNWNDAQKECDQLAKSYSQTRFFRQAREKISAFEIECASQIREIDRKVINLGYQARRAMEERRWDEARRLLDQALPWSAYMNEASQAKFSELRSRCLREKSCDADLERILDLRRQNKFDEIGPLLDIAEQRHGATDLYASRKVELEALKIQCRQESRAREAIGLAQSAARQGDWPAVQEKVALLRGALSKTKAVEEGDAALRELEQKIYDARQSDVEARAQALLNQADRELDAKNFSAARERLERLEREFYMTDVYKAGAPRIRAGLELCAGADREEGQKKLAERIARAEALFKEEKWEPAAAEFEELAKLPNGRREEFEARVKACREHRLELILEDFESGVGRWHDLYGFDTADAAESNDAKNGAKSCRLSFKPHSGLDLLCLGVESLDPRTNSISFWAKSLGKEAVKVELSLLYESKRDVSVLLRTVEIPPDWKRITVPLSEFVTDFFGNNEVGPVDPLRIGGIGFSVQNNSRKVTFLIDDMQVSSTK